MNNGIAVDRSTRTPRQRAVFASFIPVLLYHAIGEPARPGLERFTLSEPAFAQHVRTLAAHRDAGATPLLIRELAEGLRGGAMLPTHPFAVTFDDGYDDNLAAILALAEVGIPSTIYVTAGSVGAPGMLDASQICALARHPLVAVGAHSVRHVRLDEFSTRRIERELHGPRLSLQELTGTEIDSIAYPHGAHDRRVLSEVRRAGYSSGVAVKNRLSRPGDDPLAIARWMVLDHHSATDVQRVLDGGLAVVGSSQRMRTRGYRVVRRSHRLLRTVVGRAG